MAAKKKTTPKGKPVAKAPTRKPPPVEGTPEAWERQHGETLQAFEAFATYRDMGASRSYAKVAQHLRKSTTTIAKWAGEAQGTGWSRRIGAYERHLDRQRRQLAEERALRRTDEQLAALETHQKGLEIVGAALLKRIESDAAKKVDFFEGLPKDEVIRLSALVARAQPRLVETERLVSGLSTANVAGHDGGPLAQAREEAASMNRGEAEAYLLGFDDGERAEAGKKEPEPA